MNARIQLIKELNLLTGIVSDDLDYMVYLLLKGGSYFEKETEAVYVQTEVPRDGIQVIDMATWFAQFE